MLRSKKIRRALRILETAGDAWGAESIGWRTKEAFAFINADMINLLENL